ncbi:hypothetical protein BGZ94_001386 [Podila epigama]|nr:hypothetical protein BGZ94_001386 [Podila epigama]
MNSLRLLSRSAHQVGRASAQARFFQSSAAALTGKTHDATESTFKTLIGAKEPVIVDFYADWCQPCRMIDPILREAVKESEKVTLVRVNIDDCPQIGAEYQVASIPYVVAFKDGQVVDKFVGALPKKVITKFVTDHSLRAN